MKLLIASDIHGAAGYCRDLLAAWDREGADRLLLLGDLPNQEQLETFTACLSKCRALPTNFVRDVIMKAPSHDLMNSLTRSVLTLASYDDDIGKTDLQTQLEQCIKLISVFPMLAVYG